MRPNHPAVFARSLVRTKRSFVGGIAAMWVTGERRARTDYIGLHPGLFGGAQSCCSVGPRPHRPTEPCRATGNEVLSVRWL
jgi:hypothetical protein